MRFSLFRFASLSVGVFALTACVSTGPSKAPEVSATPVNGKTITYKVPDSDNVIGGRGFVKDVSFPSMSRFGGGAHYERLYFQDKTSSSFVVHRRVDNGTAGSGIKYTVEYEVDNGDSVYSLILNPKEYTTYQQGLVGKYPVPNYGEDDLHKTLMSGALSYKIELDSPYGSESVYANFRRLVKHDSFRPGEKDPVTGKIFKDRFVLTNRGHKVRFVVETYPYRDGSKAVVYATVHGSETSENVVDFSIIIDEIRRKLEEVVNA